MKKHIYLFVLILSVVTFLNASEAKAENWDHDQIYSSGPRNDTYSTGTTTNNCSNNTTVTGPANTGVPNNNSNTPTTSNTSSTKLPINNGVVFLFLSGMTIGIVTIKKIKTLSPVMAA